MMYFYRKYMSVLSLITNDFYFKITKNKNILIENKLTWVKFNK